MLCALLCFFYSANVFEIQPHCCMYQSLLCLVTPSGQNSIVWIYHSSFTCEQTFGLFQFLAILNKDAMNICIQFFLKKYVFITRIYSECILNFLRNCQNVFQSDCTMLHSHHQFMGSYPHQH